MTGLPVLANFVTDRVVELPVAFVHLTERCNSRCIGCDFWRNGERDLSPEAARDLSLELDRLHTRLVVVSGGEPLFHPRWEEITRSLARRGRVLWLLTSGLSLARETEAVASLFGKVTVSLDGASPSTYRAVRGVDAFDEVVAGVEALVARKRWVSLRTTVQRTNFREIPALIRIARELGAAEISFFPADVRSPSAFGRAGSGRHSGLGLDAEEREALDAVIDEVERSFAAELTSGLVAESASKLREMTRYFGALAGEGRFPEVRCNAPRFSAVIGPGGPSSEIKPCHFIDGSRGATLEEALERGRAVRRDIRRGERPECERCVCPMWKHPLALLGSEVA